MERAFSALWSVFGSTKERQGTLCNCWLAVVPRRFSTGRFKSRFFYLRSLFFSLVLAKRNLCHRVWRLVSCALMSELPVCLRCRLMWLICCCCDDALVGRSVSGINVQFLVAHHYCQVAGGEPPYVQHTKQKLFHFRSIVLYSERALDCACWCNVLYFLYSKQPSPPLFLFFPSL